MSYIPVKYNQKYTLNKKSKHWSHQIMKEIRKAFHISIFEEEK